MLNKEREKEGEEMSGGLQDLNWWWVLLIIVIILLLICYCPPCPKKPPKPKHDF
ncbi:hypothetical protein Adeg_2102 [Ammonifex degensii KC4]|uniref:Uncharacterized protein n=1 Tax=Ammonifex degensii (strain DSM 10501 / KC4) TaxID=429009 RepID=C9RA50_AMMDK|nr:hypothetical protein Adeg_2102 [Ammonifex degensii KC4]